MIVRVLLVISVLSSGAVCDHFAALHEPEKDDDPLKDIRTTFPPDYTIVKVSSRKFNDFTTQFIAARKENSEPSPGDAVNNLEVRIIATRSTNQPTKAEENGDLNLRPTAANHDDKLDSLKGPDNVAHDISEPNKEYDDGFGNGKCGDERGIPGVPDQDDSGNDDDSQNVSNKTVNDEPDVPDEPGKSDEPMPEEIQSDIPAMEIIMTDDVVDKPTEEFIDKTKLENTEKITDRTIDDKTESNTDNTTNDNTKENTETTGKTKKKKLSKEMLKKIKKTCAVSFFDRLPGALFNGETEELSSDDITVSYLEQAARVPVTRRDKIRQLLASYRYNQLTMKREKWEENNPNSELMAADVITTVSMPRINEDLLEMGQLKFLEYIDEKGTLARELNAKLDMATETLIESGILPANIFITRKTKKSDTNIDTEKTSSTKKQSTEEQSTEEQFTEKQSTEKQSTEEQFTEERSKEVQSTEEQSTKKQFTEERSTEEQFTEKQSTEKQFTEEQSTEKQSTEKQSTEKQFTEERSTEKQSTEKQSTEKQSTEKQSTEKQSTEKQSTEKQFIEERSTEKQSTEKQFTEKPTTEPTHRECKIEDHFSENNTESDKVESERNNAAKTSIKKKNAVDHKYYLSQFVNNATYFCNHWDNITKGNRMVVHPKPAKKESQHPYVMKLPFDFPFYGHKLKNLSISVGGYAYTGSVGQNWMTDSQNISPMMTKFDARNSSGCALVIYEDDTKLTIIWENVSLKYHNDTYTFAATLYLNGDIKFSYKHIPTRINEKLTPVHIGIADSFPTYSSAYYLRRRTIHPYSRISFKSSEIKDNTVLELIAQPTCPQYNNCEDCLNHKLYHKNFECVWCEKLGKCTSGTDYNRPFVAECHFQRSCDPNVVNSTPAPSYNFFKSLFGFKV